MPSIDDDAATAAGAQEPSADEFKMLDIEGSAASGYRSTASAISAGGEVPLGDKLSKLAFTGINVVFSCGALAVAKQVLNPANYTPADTAAQEASKALPSWFAGQYKQRRTANVMTQHVMRDTGLLMAASGLWHGLQFAMHKLRGGENDAINVCVAGSFSAAFLGATFVEPRKLSRVGVWGAVGGLLGYYGFKEQQAMRAALLQRQQELEQKHMHVGADAVRQKLDPKLLTELLKFEQKERQEQLRSQMHKHGVEVPDGGDHATTSTTTSTRDGSSDGSGTSNSSRSAIADASRGSTAAGTSSSSSGDGGAGGGWWQGEDGTDGGDGEDQWRKLLHSAPWLQDEESQK